MHKTERRPRAANWEQRRTNARVQDERPTARGNNIASSWSENYFVARKFFPSLSLCLLSFFIFHLIKKHCLFSKQFPPLPSVFFSEFLKLTEFSLFTWFCFSVTKLWINGPKIGSNMPSALRLVKLLYFISAQVRFLSFKMFTEHHVAYHLGPSSGCRQGASGRARQLRQWRRRLGKDMRRTAPVSVWTS